MTQAKKKIILLTTGLILTICLMAFFGVYALTILKNSTFNVGVKYEPEYLVKVEMGIDGANGGTVDQTIEENEYVEIFNSLNPVSNGMYIDSMSNETIHINSQTLTPIGANGDVYFRITSLENETSGNKDLKCVIDCGSSTADSGTMASGEISNLKIATGIDATSGTPTSSSLGMIKINLKFSEVLLLDLKYLVGNDETGIDLGRAGKVEKNVISGTTFYVSNIDGLLNLSALVGQVNTTTTEYDPNYVYGYDNSAGPARSFSGATIQILDNLDEIDCGNDKNSFTKKFIPIGNSTNSFQGTFDGNDKTITGLYINQTTDYAGLFGYVSNAEIKNLKMKNCKIDSTGSYVGNFVGYANGATISNCSAEETEVIGGSSNVGGIVGYVYKETTITNCYNTGSVSGVDEVGGIVGRFSTGTATITNCYNTGSVSGFAGLGGIVGRTYGEITITNCYNTGSVSGPDNHAGGIVGRTYGEITITNCYNTGSVSGFAGLGGIVGYFQYGKLTITNCYNTGSVDGSGHESVGGIVGGIYDDATITNCYNTGSVSGTRYVGGIVGYVYSGTVTITNCYNTGSVVTDGVYVGGIVGRIYSTATATITNCYYLKTSDVNANVNAIGKGTAEAGSYYGTFSSAKSGLTKCSDSPGELAYGTTDLLTVLNAYVSEHLNYTDETSGLEIELKSWEIRAGENDGYPVFMEN